MPLIKSLVTLEHGWTDKCLYSLKLFISFRSVPFHSKPIHSLFLQLTIRMSVCGSAVRWRWLMGCLPTCLFYLPFVAARWQSSWGPKLVIWSGWNCGTMEYMHLLAYLLLNTCQMPSRCCLQAMAKSVTVVALLVAEVGGGGGGGGSMLIHNCLMALNMFKQTVSKVSLSRVKKWYLCIINMSTRSIKLKCESVNYGLSSSTGKFSQ